MLRILTVCEVLCIAGIIVGCDVGADTAIEATSTLVSPTSCGVVPGPVVGPGGGSAFISPRSNLTPSFTRSFFPRFVRQGSWATATQFVADANALTLPAVTAVSSGGGGLISLPVESDGSVMIGVSLVICGDSTTLLEADTYATRFTSPDANNITDAMDFTGSLVTGGLAGGLGGQWRTVDIDTYQLTFSGDSTFWLSMFAIQPPNPPSTPPPVMAISQVIVNYSH